MLTCKQRRFVQEYLIDLNATQAAIRAGYSEKTARQIAADNLSKVDIQNAVSEAFRARSERVEVTQDYVIGTLVANVERSMQREPVIDREGNLTGEYTYQGSVANKALELLGKHLGIFPERHEHGNVPGEDFRVAVEPKSWRESLQSFMPPEGPSADPGTA